MKKTRKKISIIMVIAIVFQLFTFTGAAETSGLKVQMYEQNLASTSEAKPFFKIVNSSSTSIPLSNLKIRYYYTIDGDKTQNFWCDWATCGNTNVTGSFVKMSDPYKTTNADYYLELGFKTTSGSIAANSSVEVQTRFSKSDWSAYNKSNDYSRNSTSTVYVDWSKVTLYNSGSLVWGVEPSNSTTSPSVTSTPTITSTPTSSVSITPTPTTSGTSASPIKIDILKEKEALKVILTSTKKGSDILSCFDQDSGTYNTFYDREYCYIQMEFNTARNICRLKANNIWYVNQKWDVEAADTQKDLTDKTGTYQLVGTKNEWGDINIQTSLKKKFWKLTTYKPNWTSTLAMPDIEIYGDDNTAPVPGSSLLTATSVDARTISLSWAPASDNVEVTGYEILRAQSSTGPWETVLGRTIGTNYTDTLLTPDTTYYYRVCAYDGAYNKSSLSSVASAKTGTSKTLKTNYTAWYYYINPIIKAGTYSFINPVTNETIIKTIANDIKFSDYAGEHANVDEIAKYFSEGLKKVSGGTVNFDIQIKEVSYTDYANDIEGINVNKLFEYAELKRLRNLNDEGIYSPASYGGFNFHKLFKETGIVPKIESGEVDYVFIMGSVVLGIPENIMFGKDAFYVNSTPLKSSYGLPDNVACSKKIVTTILSYNNAFECFMHMYDFGIFTDANDRSNSPYSTQWPKTSSFDVVNAFDVNYSGRSLVNKSFNDWDRFLLTEANNGMGTDGSFARIAPGNSQIGSAHFAPNAAIDYSWAYENEIFSWPTNTNRWKRVSGDWGLKSDKYYTTSGTGSLSRYFDKVNRDAYFTDFVCETDIILGSDCSNPSDAGVVFRTSNYSAGENSFKGFYAGLDAVNDKISLYYYNNSSPVLLGQYSFMAIDHNITYRMKIEAMGSSIKIFVDDMNVPKLQCNDTTYYDGLPGIIGLRANHTDASFDNFFVNPTIMGYADTWYNYPNLNGPKTKISTDDWNGLQDDMQMYIMNHIPKNPGIHDAVDINNGNVFKGMLNNWWPYILDINHFDGSSIKYAVTGFPVPPPINLKADTVSESSVYLEWTTLPSSSGVTGSNIYRDGVLIGNTTGSFYTDIGLQPNTTYKYEVRSKNSSNTESISSNVEASTVNASYYCGFEKITNGKPDGWRWYSKTSTADFSVDSLDNISGSNYAAKITMNKTSENESSEAVFYKKIPLKANTDYRLSAWMKTKDLSGTGLGARVVIEKAGFISFNTPELKGTSDWRKVELVFNSGSARDAEIRCVIGTVWDLSSDRSISGTAWFDDVKLEEISVNNPGFENAYPTGRPTKWTARSFTTGSLFSLDNTASHSGVVSAKIQTTGDDDCCFEQVIPVQKNTNYKVSGFIKVQDIIQNGGGANISVESDTNVWLGRSGAVKGTAANWQSVSTASFNTGDNTFIKVKCRIGDYGGMSSGTAWFDDVKLEKVTN